MKRHSSSTAACVVLFCTLFVPFARAQHAHSAPFESAQDKLDWIARNGESSAPSTQPTVLNAREWNAYLNEGGVKLPDGLSRMRISSEPGIAHGEAEVDFDRLTANRTRSNPLLYLFTGSHRVNVNAHLQAENGIGRVHVDSVFFDGVEIPRFALDFFASNYLRPKYGNAVGLDSRFALHHRIDTAVVGNNQVTIAQR
jgi:hypothetical protein